MLDCGPSLKKSTWHHFHLQQLLVINPCRSKRDPKYFLTERWATRLAKSAYEKSNLFEQLQVGLACPIFPSQCYYPAMVNPPWNGDISSCYSATRGFCISPLLAASTVGLNHPGITVLSCQGTTLQHSHDPELTERMAMIQRSTCWANNAQAWNPSHRCSPLFYQKQQMWNQKL